MARALKNEGVEVIFTLCGGHIVDIYDGCLFKTVGCPLVLSDSPVTVTSSPLLGEHTEVILSELLGMTEREIAEARSAGAV